MKEKWTFGKALNYAFLFLCIMITLYPIVYVLSMSFSSARHVMLQDVWLLPKGPTLASYKLLLQNNDIWVAYYNTVWYAVVGTLIGLFCTITISYAISRKRFHHRRIVTWFVMFTMFFSGGIVPTYILINQLHLDNTRWAIVLPSAVVAWNIVIARTYFASLPESLIESAYIDGASEFRILRSIILPLSKPIVAVLALYLIVGFWNTYFTALLYLDDTKLQPLQNYLQKLLFNFDFANSTTGASSGNLGAQRGLQVEQLKYSTIVVAMFPIMCIYPFLQKYFVQGIMIGSIKE